MKLNETLVKTSNAVTQKNNNFNLQLVTIAHLVSISFFLWEIKTITPTLRYIAKAPTIMKSA